MGNDTNIVYNRLFLRNGTQRNISVFISGADNIGTSWCALSLAHAFNLEKKKVLLVDGNGDFSNIASYLFLQTPQYLEEYVLGKKTLNQLVCAYKNKDFNILTGQSGNDYLAEQPLGRIHLFADDLNILSENYEHTFIDAGTNISEKTLSLCQIADNVILMCSENNADLVKTFELIKFMNEINLSANYYLIINKVNSFEDGYKIYEKLNKAADRNHLKFPELLGIVRIDTRIRDTIKNKELLLSRYPTSEAAVDICNIAKKLGKENP
ncbi:MAG: hypothetical protein NC218_02940 [Acetobacter sp.]|nr:hypothetical protein [Acetobacter sp.]